MRIADILLTGNCEAVEECLKRKIPGSLRDKMADYVEIKSHKMQNCGLQILAGIL